MVGIDVYYSPQKDGRYIPTVNRKTFGVFLQSTESWWYVRQSTENGRYVRTFNRKMAVCSHSPQKDGGYVSSINRKAVGMFLQKIGGMFDSQ